MNSIILATNVNQLNKQIQHFHNDFNLDEVFIAENEASLRSILKVKIPNILLFSKRFECNNFSIIDYMIELHKQYPHTKIIYLAGPLHESDIIKYRELKRLIHAGIFNFYTDKSIDIKKISQMLITEKTKEDVVEIENFHLTLDDIVTKKTEETAEIIHNKEEMLHYSFEKIKSFENVVVVSSIKPGTGKSFISSNLAMAVAKNGKRTKNGSRPKVAYIEADLQNLSIGTLLGLDTKENHLKHVLFKIGELFNEKGEIDTTRSKKEEVDNFIFQAFQTYPTVSTLYSLVGSHLLPEELEKIKMVYYLYLIETISPMFDFIVIDTNSSMITDSSLPFLKLCKFAFFIVNLDFNNIRNNGRYQSYLEELGLASKIYYILNEDIDEESRRLLNIPTFEELIMDTEKLESSGLSLLAKIPEIPKEIFYNRLYLGKPIILDSTEITLKIRIELSKLANQIWEIDNLKWLNEEYEEFQRRKAGIILN